MQESSPTTLPITLEPKYCEACGAIRLRPSGSEAIYCERCALRLAEIARPASGRCA